MGENVINMEGLDVKTLPSGFSQRVGDRVSSGSRARPTDERVGEAGRLRAAVLGCCRGSRPHDEERTGR
ncbi:hypothetical protein BN12_310005 [Nostocoides japonicum T1-X7]|uniref:Uncharacterized protein n=1 Tax=Nostocoides japonicum T1-X7 TaxID=1194083 RepID=A0A077M0I3_9MICO|nr:hypothetical protein BN12_310005 [Tetrasphaera japonica T1-X7]